MKTKKSGSDLSFFTLCRKAEKYFKQICEKATFPSRSVSVSHGSNTSSEVSFEDINEVACRPSFKRRKAADEVLEKLSEDIWIHMSNPYY